MAVVRYSLSGVLSWLSNRSGLIKVTITLLDGKKISRSGSLKEVQEKLGKLDKLLPQVVGVRVQRAPRTDPARRGRP